MGEGAGRRDMTDILITLIALIAAIGGAAFWGGKRQRDKQDAKSLKRVKRGQDAVTKGKASGKSNDDRVRGNKW